MRARLRERDLLLLPSLSLPTISLPRLDERHPSCTVLYSVQTTDDQHLASPGSPCRAHSSSVPACALGWMLRSIKRVLAEGRGLGDALAWILACWVRGSCPFALGVSTPASSHSNNPFPNDMRDGYRCSIASVLPGVDPGSINSPAGPVLTSQCLSTQTRSSSDDVEALVSCRFCTDRLSRR
jgi:hypothetical protein